MAGEIATWLENTTNGDHQKQPLYSLIYAFSYLGLRVSHTIWYMNVSDLGVKPPWSIKTQNTPVSSII